MKISILGSGPIANRMARMLGSESTVTLYTSQDILISDFEVLKYSDFLWGSIDSDIVILAWRGLPEPDSEKYNVLEYLAQNVPGQALIINLSSVSVYGQNLDPNDESIPPKPINTYGFLKLELERYLNNKLGSSVCHLRISNVFGLPALNDVVNAFLNSYSSGEALELVKPSSTYRDFISIDNLIEIIVELVVKFREVGFRETFNVASGSSISLEDVKFIFESCIDSTIAFVEAETNGEIIEVSRVENSKIKSFLGIHIGDQIEELRDYFNENLNNLNSEIMR